MTDTTTPCPFCGNVGLDFKEGATFRWLLAECNNCGASRGETRIQTAGKGTKEEWLEAAKFDAIQAWNERAALAQQAGQVWQPTDAAMDALRRFEETCTDNEGYDVPKDTMRNLQAIGLIYRTYGNRYCITDFGNHMLAAAPKGGL